MAPFADLPFPHPKNSQSIFKVKHIRHPVLKDIAVNYALSLLQEKIISESICGMFMAKCGVNKCFLVDAFLPRQLLISLEPFFHKQLVPPQSESKMQQSPLPQPSAEKDSPCRNLATLGDLSRAYFLESSLMAFPEPFELINGSYCVEDLAQVQEPELDVLSWSTAAHQRFLSLGSRLEFKLSTLVAKLNLSCEYPPRQRPVKRWPRETVVVYNCQTHTIRRERSESSRYPKAAMWFSSRPPQVIEGSYINQYQLVCIMRLKNNPDSPVSKGRALLYWAFLMADIICRLGSNISLVCYKVRFFLMWAWRFDANAFISPAHDSLHRPS
jgi:hypothetical protein